MEQCNIYNCIISGSSHDKLQTLIVITKLHQNRIWNGKTKYMNFSCSNNTDEVLGIIDNDDKNFPSCFGTYYQNKHHFFTVFKDPEE